MPCLCLACLSDVCLSIHPLSTYLCKCIYRSMCFSVLSDLSCRPGWLIDWLHGTRMLNYSAVQEIPCHYENRNLITEHPALRQINPFYVPTNNTCSRLILVLPLVRIDCKNGFLPWYFCWMKILYEFTVQCVCGKCARLFLSSGLNSGLSHWVWINRSVTFFFFMFCWPWVSV